MAGTKLQIVTCFVLFAVLLAPFAWRLTQVERVELPVERIRALSWNTSRFAPRNTPRPVLELITLAGSEAALDDLSALDASPRVEFVTRHLETTALATSTDHLQAMDDALRAALGDGVTSDFQVIFLCETKPSNGATPQLVVGKYRHAWTRACGPKDVASDLATLVEEHLFPVADRSRRDTSHARVAAKYRLQFTLLKEDAADRWTWDFETLRRRYLVPLLDKVASIAEFQIEQQVVHYARLAKDVHYDSTQQVHFVKTEDLRHFKSTNDFLTSSVLSDREQVLRFMAALPSVDHAPLLIRPEPSKGQNNEKRWASSFAIPGWGIVSILDRQRVLGTDHDAELRRVAQHFVAQFRTLMGLPAFHERAARASKTLVFLPAIRDGLAEWELDAVVRDLLRLHVRSSIETLQSIIHLVSEMPQIIVLDRVAQRITNALELVEHVLCIGNEPSDDGRQQCPSLSSINAHALLARARHAADEADAAYYDHTMIRQLYFPQEQMLGVFAPLLGPLLLPFVLGWIREFKRYKAKTKEKQKKEQEQKLHHDQQDQVHST